MKTFKTLQSAKKISKAIKDNRVNFTALSKSLNDSFKNISNYIMKSEEFLMGTTFGLERMDARPDIYPGRVDADNAQDYLGFCIDFTNKIETELKHMQNEIVSTIKSCKEKSNIVYGYCDKIMKEVKDHYKELNRE
jgi:hypothetical protein